MHVYDSGAALLVNAEVDSMGGVVDGGVGVGVGLKTSPRRAAIEKAQAELRQEYDVREERRRELDFLEKGGNPLDFKLGNADSVSVQSTSLTDQHPEQFVTSEAKGSFALTASPRGDSVESSDRPEVPTLCEPNSADNLLLFDGGNDTPEGERNSRHISRRTHISPSVHLSQMDGTQNAKESEDSAIFRPYARRNRSRPNRDGTRSSSTDMQGRGCQGSSLPSRGMLKNSKGQISETINQRDHNLPLATNAKSVKSNGDISPKLATFDNQLSMEFDKVHAPDTFTGSTKGSPERKLDVTAPESVKESQQIQPSETDTQDIQIAGVSGRSDERELLASSTLEGSPSERTTKNENEISYVQVNGFSNLNIEGKSVPNEGHRSSAAGTKGLDSEALCTQTSLGLDVNNDTDICTTRNDDNTNITETSNVEGPQNPAVDEMMLETNERGEPQGSALNSNHCGNGEAKVDEDMNEIRSEVRSEINLHPKTDGEQYNGSTVSEAEKKLDEVVVKKENSFGRAPTPQDLSMSEPPETTLPVIDSTKGTDCQATGDDLKVVDKAHEDSILEEARMIEAKRKRIAELSIRSLPIENRRVSQWDFVLEEMSWLANDFAQERLWKLTAAAQICHRAAFTSRLRAKEKQQEWNLKKVAHTLANAVNQFWRSAETLLNSDDSSDRTVNDNINWNKESNKELDKKSKTLSIPMQRYAVVFLKYNNSLVPQLQASAPATPEKLSDTGITEMSWQDHLTEENLFYAVPFGAMEAYRRSIESHLIQFERTSSMQEEIETLNYDAGAVSELSQEVLYDEDEGETSPYYLPGVFEGSKSSTYNQKKRKGFKSTRTYEAGADLPYGPCTTASQQFVMRKRPASLNVGSIPTKRMRTASRTRVVSPFGAGATGNVQAQIKTDASSGDTNSYQDDQSTLHGGSQFQKNMEVESVGEFERHLPYDHAETSMKPKKKKKQKHLGPTYDQGWQMDSSTPNEQRDYLKKRSESHHFESNGTIGLYGQHSSKKPKISKQSLDSTYDGMTAMAGSLPSPLASQMSNMTNPSKFMKLIGGRDRGRKGKSHKMPVGQPGFGSPWSLFEDQALVVLVHDMGPNWELISDAINSTLHLKCVFRKPKECKERHKILMDLNSGDGADSAEDSGSSQSYPSTIPGIPKGSARQLFQRLQEPMEEDTLKSHFERIIKIGQKHHYGTQNDNQDPKQVTTVHNSHVIALSQVCQNNLNGGILTPLDLCDNTSSSPDVLSSAYQGSHTGGLPLANQGAMSTLLPSGPNGSLQGTPGMALSNNLSSPSGSLSATSRGGRYSGPRASALPIEDQQRMQQYNQMLSGRNVQQPSLSGPGTLPGTDRGVRMVAGANGMGMMSGMNRSTMSRPGFQGIAASPMMNNGSMLSSSMVGIPSPVNMHSGAGSGPNNIMLRPREGHMMRPAHNPEHQRQLMAPEIQMQATHGNGQGIASFNGLSSGFSSQTTSSGGQMYPGHPQQQHQLAPQQPLALSSPHHPHLQGPNQVAGSQQQAYAIHMAKERQLQQQWFLQQQQFAPPNSLMLHAQPQAQLPLSSNLQSSSHIQSQSSPHSPSMSPSTPSSPLTPISSQHQQKHHLPSHGRNPGASGLTNQTGKQRQRPQQHHLQQSGRHHPQQRPFGQSQQQAKLSKGMERGNSMVHQNPSNDPLNIPIDPSHLNGLSVPPGSQTLEKGEQIMQLMQGQTAYSGPGINTSTSKPLVPQPSNNSQLQQRMHPTPATSSSKQLQQKPSHSDSSGQGQAPAVPSGHAISASHQSTSPATVSSNHQQLQPQQQKQANQAQPYVQRVQQSHQVNSEVPIEPQTDLAPAEEQPVNSNSQVDPSPAAESCVDSSSVVPVSSAISQWEPSEAAHDFNLPYSTAQGGSLGSPPLTKSSANEPVPPFSQGLGPRQLSGNFASHEHISAQWQPKQLLQKSPSLPPMSQQLYDQQEQQKHQGQELIEQQLPLPQQAQQQMQRLDIGQGGLYNSKSE